MRLLHLFLTSCIIIAVDGSALVDLDMVAFDDTSHDPALFDLDKIFDQPTEPPLNFFLDANDQSRFAADEVSGLSFDNNGPWSANDFLPDSDYSSQLVETNSDSLLSGLGACFGLADDGQLWGKVRRGESCRSPPVGQTEKPNQPMEFNPYASVLSKALRRNEEICPFRIFGYSNIPVCKGLAEVEDFQPIGPNCFNIEYIMPRMFIVIHQIETE